MPIALLVEAATMPAMAVPWPLASLSQAEPSTNDAPATTLPARSEWELSTPVSRTATTEVPVVATVPYAWSQPIFGSDHWSGYETSSGVASAARLRSSSTEATDESARRAATAASEAWTACILRTAIESRSVAPAAASAAACSAGDVPGTDATMYGETVTGGEV